jgi:hypothetical protein
MPFAARCWPVVGALVLSIGCVARPNPGRHAEGAFSSGNSVVTAAELARYTPGTSLLDALQRLRPSLLHPRGASALVSIDGTAPTDQGVLSTIAVSAVAEVRLLRATNSVGKPAILRNGDVTVGDVLLVVTRH